MQGSIWRKTCRYHLRSISRAQCRAYTRHRHHEDDNPIFTGSELPKPKMDYASISRNLDTKISNALARKAPIDVTYASCLSKLYTQYKDQHRSIDSIRAEQHILGADIRLVAKTKDFVKRDELLVQAKSLKSQLLEKEKSLNELEHRLLSLSLTLPNDTHPESPFGPESNAKTISTHGPPPLPPSPHRNHLSISKKFNLLDFESGAVVTGSSWYYLLNEAAILEMALVNYAVSVAVRAGFVPVITPDVVRADIAARCGFTPREPGGAASQMYHITNHHAPPSSSRSSPELVLAGTAEIPLAGLFANKIYPSNQLPLKYVGVGRSFRSEAGASAESRGLYRVHQFTKVELFAVTPEEQSEMMMEHLKDVQKNILEGLGLTFRILDMPSEELGASAFRKYDIEVWMPGHQTWGEVSSLSNCTDYQSRRLHIRYRPLVPPGTAPRPSKTSGPLPFAHTLNGTAAAIPRLIVALLENGAVLDENGDVQCIRLPKILKPFWIETGRNVIQWDDDETTPQTR